MKTYDVLLNPKAVRELKSLPVEMQKRFKEGLDKLSRWPKRSESGKDVAKISGTSEPDLYRLNIGGYRAIYWLDEDKKEVLVEKIAPRKKAYHDLSDLL